MIEIIATLIGIFTGIIGTYLALKVYIRELRDEWKKKLETEMQRQADAKVKEYAAQRDFEHLRRHHEQLKGAFEDMQNEVEEMKATLIELQVTSRGAFNRIEQAAARLEAGATGGWVPPKN